MQLYFILCVTLALRWRGHKYESKHVVISSKSLLVILINGRADGSYMLICSTVQHDGVSEMKSAN